MCQQQLVNFQPSAAIVCTSVVDACVSWWSPVLQGSPELVPWFFLLLPCSSHLKAVNNEAYRQ